MEKPGSDDLSVLLQDISEMGDIHRESKVKAPIIEVLQDTSDIITRVWSELGKLPTSVFPSYMEGLYFDYIIDEQHRVILEVYNVGDAAIFSTDDAKVVEYVGIPKVGRVGKVYWALIKLLS